MTMRGRGDISGGGAARASPSLPVWMTNTGVQILEVGDLVATRYRLTEEIGRGAMGIVYRANQEEMNREVALKTLLPQAVFHPRMVARFKREVRVISQLKHPNTITIFDYGDLPNGLLYFAMEMLDGTPLGTVIREAGTLEPERVRRVAMQILKSLDEAHSKGIIHRDLKPDNIFICDVHGESDFVKVLDFGIAKALDPVEDGDVVELTGTGMSVGTPVYMAPEQIERSDVAAATDLYGLGSLMYEMLSGRPLFLGTSWIEIAMKKLGETPVKLRGDIVSSELGGIIVKALRRDITQRYQTAREMLDDLEAVGPIDAPALPPSGDGVKAEMPMDAMVIDTPFGPRVVTSPGVDLAEYARARKPAPDDSTQIDTRALLDDSELGVALPAMEDEATRIEASMNDSDAPTFDYGSIGADGVIVSDSVDSLPPPGPMEDGPTRIQAHRDVDLDDVETRVRQSAPLRQITGPQPAFDDDEVTNIHKPPVAANAPDNLPTRVKEPVPLAVFATKLPNRGASSVIVEMTPAAPDFAMPRDPTRVDVQFSASLAEGDPAPLTPAPVEATHEEAAADVPPNPLSALLTTQNTLLLVAGLAILFMLLLAVVLLATALVLMG